MGKDMSNILGAEEDDDDDEGNKGDGSDKEAPDDADKAGEDKDPSAPQPLKMVINKDAGADLKGKISKFRSS